MNKFYTTKVNLNRHISKLILFSVLIFSSLNSYSQLIVPFTPRTSTVSPTRTVYTVKGDFSMIGNTNLTSAVYSDNSANNNAMIYVDIDTDDNTWNSSSATFALPTENGSIPGCSNIVYAGLYWTGSAVGVNGEQFEFTTTKDGISRTFDKRTIKFKPPNAADYVEVTADDNDIYFPQPGDFSNIYSAYAEVTDLIDATNFLGEYIVADLPSVEGILPPAGYHGGWGMVVVYENTLMNWRDITVFDGHAHVSGEIADYTFDVNGFNTAQSGDVNIKLGIMAAEGDVNISGDYLEILRQDNNTFERLSHSTNTTDDFFNSSINIGGNLRNPQLNNNTGLDIAMFNIDNTGKGIITNNQTSTRFRYGTTSDRFVIFNLTFSVNSYVPEVTGVITNTSINGSPVPAPVIIEPGQSALYELEIKNIGTEATNNTVVTIPLPNTVNPSNLNILFETFYTPLSSDYTDPQYDGSVGTNGAIIWDLGTLPLPNDIDDVLAKISFELTATTNCAILGDINNTPSITLFGSISGVGAVSNVSFDTPLIQGYSVDDICKDNPIPIPIIIPIDYVNYINQGPTITCPEDISQNIDSGTSGAIVNYTEPIGTDNAPGAVTTRIAGLAPGALFPIGITTVTYQVTDDCNISTVCSFTVTVIDNSPPTFTAPDDTEIFTDANCNYDASVTFTGDVTDEADNCSTNLQATFTDNIVDGDCEGTFKITRTWSLVGECGNAAANQIQTITVSDNTAPTFTVPDAIDIYTDASCNYDASVTNTGDVTDEADNCSTNIEATFVDQIVAGTCEGTFEITRTWSLVDNCGNAAANQTQIITVFDNTAPTFTVPNNIDIYTDESCNYDASVTNTGDVTDEADNCSTNIQATFVDQIVAGTCEGTFEITRTWSLVDNCGNAAANQTQTINVFDNRPPIIDNTNTDNFEIECGVGNTQNDLTTWLNSNAGATATDNCSTITWSNDYGSDSSVKCDNGDITVTFTATDACGNKSTTTATYLIKDTTAPIINNTLGDLDATLECSDTVGINNALSLTPTATDDCSTPTINLVSDVTTINPDCPNEYTQVRIWNFTDGCGNTSDNFTQTIIVVDTTSPVIDNTNTGNFEIECGVGDTQTKLTAWLNSNAGATATDNCSKITWSNDYGDDDSAKCDDGDITVTFTATDACGNVSTITATYLIKDTTAPVISNTPGDLNATLECSDTTGINNALSLTPTATDDCSTPTINVVSDITTTSTDCSNGYTQVRIWNFTDGCGNTSDNFTQTITVEDNTPPVFVDALPSTTLIVDCDAIPVAETLTATDTCGDAIVTVSNIRTDGTCPNSYILARTWTATDACGLTTEHTQLITVQDTTAPVPTSTFNETLNVSCTDIPDAPELEFTDNCSSNIVVVFDETNSFDENTFTDYEIVRTWTVRDACNNEAVYTQTLFVALDEEIIEFNAKPQCFDDGVVNLNELEIEGSDSQPIELPNLDGTWEIISGDPAATLSGNIFDPSGLEISETFLPEDGGIDYRFRYTTTDSGCISITEITMNINANCKVLNCGENDIEISKAVTPNNDFRNDFFYISGIKLCGYRAEVKIFNRWGALIFESNEYPQINEDKKNDSPPASSWDGTANKNSIGNAQKVPNGTYYYIIKLKDPETGLLQLDPITGPVYLGTK